MNEIEPALRRAYALGQKYWQQADSDMTNDFLHTLIEKADYHGGQFDIQSGNEKWVVTVTKEPS